MASLEDILAALQTLFDQAERAIKEVETFQNDLVIPAVNELRYAGYHLLKALNLEDDTTRSVELERCRSHCLRAIYEAYESGIALALDRIRKFQEDYRDAVVSEVVNDYVDILQRAEEARKQLVSQREHGEERQNDFARLQKLFDTLKKDACRLDLAREEINKKLRKERMIFWVVILTLVATVFGAGMTALSWLIP